MQLNVKVINIPGSVADWNLAKAANTTELPELNDNQRSIAHSWGIPEIDYRRSVLGRQIAEKRYRRYAEQFGELLKRAAEPHSIQSAEVIYDVWEERFYCYLRSDNAVIPVRFDAAIITAPLEEGARDKLQGAEKNIRFGVEEAVRITAASVGTSAEREP